MLELKEGWLGNVGRLVSFASIMEEVFANK